MTDNQPIDELLEQGIQAAKTQNPITARRLLEQVVEMDQHNEKAWFWLAAVTDDIDEKRICLNNVLLINPDNQRATTLLEQLEESSMSSTDDEFTLDSVDSVDRIDPVAVDTAQWHMPNQTVLIGGAVAAVLLLLIVVVLLILGGGDDDGEDTPLPAAVSNDSGATDTTAPPTIPGDATSEPVSGLPIPTLIASVTASPPPPTWTPAPSSTPIPAIIPTLFPPPPETLPGTIILESGNVPGDPENRPIVLMKADSSGKRALTEKSRGHAPVLSPNGSQYAYIEFLSGTREEILMIDNIQGTAPHSASTYWQGTVRLFEPDTPAWSPDGNWIAFSAVGMGAVLPDLYRVLMVATEGDQPTLERLTEDDVIESWPAFSPDSTRIVYVADKSRLDFGNPIDLSIYDLTTGAITDITTNGAAIIESAPDWSPDGQYIIFQGASTDSADTDIYRIPAFGLGEPEKIIDSDANDIRPRYSPNGRYIVFSSNRTGNWDVFVYDILDDTTYQFTSNPETDIASDWSR